MSVIFYLILWFYTDHGVSPSSVAKYDTKAACEEAAKEFIDNKHGSGDFTWTCVPTPNSNW